MVKSIIIQSGNQIHAQNKSSAAIAIFARQNPKDFQMPNDMFNHHALFCQLLVELFLLFGQTAALRLLKRCSGFFVQIKQALITAVRQAFNFCGQTRFAALVKRKVMSCTLGKSGVNNALCLLTGAFVAFLSCAAFSCPNNTVFVFFRTFDFRFHNIHDHDFNIGREILSASSSGG